MHLRDTVIHSSFSFCRLNPVKPDGKSLDAGCGRVGEGAPGCPPGTCASCSICSARGFFQGRPPTSSAVLRPAPCLPPILITLCGKRQLQTHTCPWRSSQGGCPAALPLPSRPFWLLCPPLLPAAPCHVGSLRRWARGRRAAALAGRPSASLARGLQ